MQPDRADVAAVSSADPFGAFMTYYADPTVTSGPLADLRLAVKDNIAVKGQPFTAGLPLFKDRIADRNAASVRLLIEAGARFVGMTRTDAAGFGVTTPEVINPILPGDIVGGSSGGSAAAVAAGLADIGLGTDTGGSVRIPAACCGVFGFKPTQNRISLDGVWPLAPTFDTIGLMARDLASLERAATILLNLRANRDPIPTSLRLGIDRERLGQSESAVVAALEQALTRFADADITLHPVTLPDRHITSQIHAALVLNEAHTLYSSWRHTFNLLPELVRRTLAAAETVAPNTVAAARRDIHSVIKAFRDCCAGLDAIITPTLPILPPPVGTRRMALNGREQSIIPILTAETCLANITGGPALSLPLAHSHDSAVGLQILAPHGHDSRVLAMASRLAPLVCGRSDHM